MNPECEHKPLFLFPDSHLDSVPKHICFSNWVYSSCSIHSYEIQAEWLLVVFLPCFLLLCCQH